MQPQTADSIPAYAPATHSEDQRKLTESALRYAFRVALPRANSTASRRLGYGTPPQNRMMHRTPDVMRALAKEMIDAAGGGSEAITERAAGEMLRDHAISGGGAWSRAEAELAEERALALVEVVHALPTPLRTVLVMRATGRSWKAVYAALPGRATWSVAEDYGRALAAVWADADDLVRGCRGA